MLRFLGVFGDIAVSANEEETHCAALRRQRSEVRILSGAPLTCTNDVLTRCNRSIVVVSMKVWVDHMVDHFSTYIYQKRGFYYFSRRVPKDVQPLHGRQRIVLALNTRSRAKALKYSQVICQRLEEHWLPMRLVTSKGQLW